MTTFTTHTIDSAPDLSKPVLEKAQKKLGFIPNLMATMAEAPVMVESYLTLMGLFDQTELSETERQIILMTNNRLNGCSYCMAAHTSVARLAGVDEVVIEALRRGVPIADPKLEALRVFTVIVHETHGRPTQHQIAAFLAAGYTRQTILEVVVGTALKVLSNYTTPITEPVVDEHFAAAAWSSDLVEAA